MAFIYKITNDINQKVYIGMTERTIEERFKEHCREYKQRRCEKRPLYSAMKKYGPEHFHVELVEETNSPEEREQYWIKYYNSTEIGYNETDATSKCGGNTYQSKTPEEMNSIKEKIRQTKIGNKNPMAKKVKRINIQTGEVEIFDTVISCAQACGIRNGKTSITTRLNGQVKSPYKNLWIFEYYNE